MSRCRAIIFDLDDTLIDTSGLLIPIKDSPAFEERISQPLPLLNGSLENLMFLGSRYFLILLTHGQFHVQKQKILSARLQPFFRAFYFSDADRAETKDSYFQKILGDFHFSAESVISVGNRILTDLVPAGRLGMETCLFNYGEHRSENAEEMKVFSPTWTIDRHGDFLRECGLLEGSPKKV